MSTTTRFPSASAVLSVILMLVCTTTTFAQSVPVSAGDRVRLKSASASGTYIVDSVSSGDLTLRAGDGGVVRVPVESLDRLSVSLGQRSRSGTMLRYGGVGFLAGAAVGATLGYTAGSIFPPAAALLAVVSAIQGGLAGFAVGGLVGFALPGESWEQIPLDRTRIGMGRDGGLSLSYEIRF